MKNLIAYSFITLGLISCGHIPKHNSDLERSIAFESKVSIEDTVYRIAKEDDFGYKVFFEKHAGVYYLKNNSRHFSVILGALEGSLNTGESIKVKADSTSLFIDEVILETK